MAKKVKKPCKLKRMDKPCKKINAKKQLKKGVKVEASEHEDVTKGKKSVAKKIAKAHLKEIPDYYRRLAKMEKKAKKPCKRKK